jgi:hypothetical protein
MAGTSGNAAARVAVVTATARSFPVLGTDFGGSDGCKTSTCVPAILGRPPRDVARSSVWPSGAALTTVSAAIVPPAPGLFSR